MKNTLKPYGTFFLNTFWNLGSDQIQNFLQKISKLILLLSTFPKVFKKNVPQGLRVFLMKIRLVFHVGRGILKFHRQNFELGETHFPLILAIQNLIFGVCKFIIYTKA